MERSCKGANVLPVTQPVSNCWREHRALSIANGLASSFIHPPPDYRWKRHCSLYVISQHELRKRRGNYPHRSVWGNMTQSGASGRKTKWLKRRTERWHSVCETDRQGDRNINKCMIHNSVSDVIRFCAILCATIVHSPMHTHMNRLTVLWIGFCLTGPISLCLDSFLYCVLLCVVCLLRFVTRWGGPGGIEAYP